MTLLLLTVSKSGLENIYQISFVTSLCWYGGVGVLRWYLTRERVFSRISESKISDLRSQQSTKNKAPRAKHQEPSTKSQALTGYWILPQALVFQLSIASSGKIHGGSGIISSSESA